MSALSRLVDIEEINKKIFEISKLAEAVVECERKISKLKARVKYLHLMDNLNDEETEKFAMLHYEYRERPNIYTINLERDILDSLIFDSSVLYNQICETEKELCDTKEKLSYRAIKKIDYEYIAHLEYKLKTLKNHYALCLNEEAKIIADDHEETYHDKL